MTAEACGYVTDSAHISDSALISLVAWQVFYMLSAINLKEMLNQCAENRYGKFGPECDKIGVVFIRRRVRARFTGKRIRKITV